MLNNDAIYVCYASSNEYAEYTGVSLLSLLMNNTDVDFGEIFILDYGINDENKANLQEIAERFQKVIKYIDAGTILEGLREKLNLSDFCGSLATYSRAFIDYIMPDYVKYLLYIDSDTIVAGSIKDIRKIDMSKCVMAGALGVNQYAYHDEDTVTDLGLINGNKKYIACGIVFYNIQNWRMNNCRDYIADTCKKNIELPFADQSLINNAIPEEMLCELPPEFNYWGHIYPKHREYREMKRGNFYSDEQIKKLAENPIIIHYKGLFYRPWLKGCKSRKKELYSKYKALSPWKDVPYGNLYKVIRSKNTREMANYILLLMYEQAPYFWMANAIRKFKRCFSKNKNK